MSLTAEQLLDAVLALPDEDRLEVTEALIASLQPSDRPPLDDSWKEIVHRRSAELRTGQVAGVPWEEVKRRAREKTGG
jgi:putative addiction module component (TIGR02574 family)